MRRKAYRKTKKTPKTTMKPISEVCALVFGHGLELPIAERLARDCKRVLWFSEWQEGFSTVNKWVIGYGLENLQRCNDIWQVKNEVDLFVFPDIQHSGLQLELESQGFPVWGSRRGDSLETDREKFLDTLKRVGLEVPPHQVCVGITELRKHLKERENAYVKISKFRGSLETHHWRSWRLDENWLDLIAVRFGAVRDLVRFLVFDNIEADVEIGCDTFCVDGVWPELALHGVECKDSGYLSAVTPRGELPEIAQQVLEAFGPELAKYRYRNEFSIECRDSFFIDVTCRLGLPSTGSQLELWKNFSEIVWHGAHGELVQPKPLGQHSAELIVKAKSDDALWATVEIPEELKQWLKLADCCEVDGIRSWPREGADDQSVGWLVAIGDTPQDVLETIKGYVEMLPEGLSCDLAPLADVIKQIEAEEEEGIEFTKREMPEAAQVVE